jgi:hypothetical protein
LFSTQALLEADNQVQTAAFLIALRSKVCSTGGVLCMTMRTTKSLVWVEVQPTKVYRGQKEVEGYEWGVEEHHEGVIWIGQKRALDGGVGEVNERQMYRRREGLGGQKISSNRRTG